ncbi:beta-ketoacyl synthase N-terminal-like domain-containing protein [Streptomyces olivoreticuli]|uniref:beta-ketoacyl synthase N-terminal-like domain-containing protein n=1 Tax=Streptomyces olivoreticuli TaxID=68246 RepID=UPI0026590F0B|nr:beta-ketoacyl synthase N-terminal-like domain-containing protein [Streptomyces olivoreticuli]WKK26917.1 beta-ketoacyl synthase N-terminal-like domain-containing protein [Streptomyces olivoreticuli]
MSSPDDLWEVLQQGEPQLGEPVRFDIGPIFDTDPEALDRTCGRVGGFIRSFRPHPVLAAEREQGRWNEAESETLWLRHSLLQALDHVTVTGSQRVGCYVAALPGGFLSAEDAVLVSVAGQLADRRASAAGEQAGHERRLRELLAGRYRHAPADSQWVRPDVVLRRAVEGLLPPAIDWLTVSTACASSLNAIDIGLHRLRAGDCDVAFCGSVYGLGRFMAVGAAKFKGSPCPVICGRSTRRRTALFSPRPRLWLCSSGWKRRGQTVTASSA